MMDTLNVLLGSLDFPALVLTFMLVGMAVAMASAQRRADFDWGDAFRDEHGKVSWFRAAIVVCLGVSSWVLIYAFMNGMRAAYDAAELVQVLEVLFKYFLAYMIVWSGAKIVEKSLEVIIAKWFPKAGEPPKVP